MLRNSVFAREFGDVGGFVLFPRDFGEAVGDLDATDTLNALCSDFDGDRRPIGTGDDALGTTVEVAVALFP